MLGQERMNEFIDFVHDSDTQIIERDEYHVVIKKYDMIIEANIRGMFGTRIESQVFDYIDYVDQNMQDLVIFKERTIREQREQVAQRIRTAAPFGSKRISI